MSLSEQAMMARGAPWLEGLNKAQREAVEALDGPVLMLAGAGTGKTRALTSRIAHLIGAGRARPGDILAVTFTNKAAREMRNRLSAMLGPSVEGMAWLGTFHSVSVKILRRHAELITCERPLPDDALLDDERPALHLKSNFTILDSDDQKRLMKQVITALGMDEKRWPARQLAAVIDNWKNRAIRPEKVPGVEAAAFNNRGAELYAAYQRRLLELNACDFGDLVLHVLTIMQQNPEILERWRARFRYVLVDEYQDTNAAQYLWLRLFAGGHHNICCVGDDDQSIYGWRGAEIGNILRFEKDFPGATVVRLEQNYRSSPEILRAAGQVIAANRGRLGKTLWTEAEPGEKLRLSGYWDGEEEARSIGEEIESLTFGTRGLPPFSADDIAILVRASHQMRAFEDRFLTIGLPYRVIGGPRFYERLEIRDAMAYFRLVCSAEDDLAFERVVNTPKRGLGDKAQATIQRLAREAAAPLTEAAQRALNSSEVTGRGAGKLKEFLNNLSRWRTLNADERTNHVELAEQILEESGYIAMWQADKTPEAVGRLENLKELVKALEEFENLAGFLEHVALVMDNDSGESEAKVSIMTLHAAKGLEFPAVFLPGWEEGLFPNQRALDQSGDQGLEEERRLAYVGITRAEALCMISFAGNRRVFGQWQAQLPSRFIDELPADVVDVTTPPGLYGGGFGAAQAESETRLEAQAVQADVYNSPGWRRLQARRGDQSARSSQSARGQIIDLKAVPEFDLGERVFHQKFGYGRVEAIDADKIDVAFEKAGLKKVVGRFLSKAEMAGSDEPPF